ncbi:dynein light chain 4, axonemal-like isoform X1 [Sipha flava]|uniref:Dynein light chain n=1 Tax=Sipha flava TaxID=143950 RepID=A0A8B8FLP3_9HEMI|nr:dynein light chain 4, axonemal-like isoform X1 [Sipha flava]
MEEFADIKEDENKKILHTYPLVRVCDMSEEMKTETIEVIITACDKFGTDYYVLQFTPNYFPQSSAKAIKQMLDKKYGSPWNAVVGEAFGIQMTHQSSTLMYMFFGGNLGICVWKI